MVRNYKNYKNILSMYNMDKLNTFIVYIKTYKSKKENCPKKYFQTDSGFKKMIIIRIHNIYLYLL